MKYCIQFLREVIYEVEVEANSEREAIRMVKRGEFEGYSEDLLEKGNIDVAWGVGE